MYKDLKRDYIEEVIEFIIREKDKCEDRIYYLESILKERRYRIDFEYYKREIRGIM